MSKKSIIMSRLRENGYRITTQRDLLIGIILDNECSSCKEIYYKAIKEDATVGLATVYRIVKTLEELDVINRKNLYNISYESLEQSQEQNVVMVYEEDNKEIEVPKGSWFAELEKELKKVGYTGEADLSISIRANQKKQREGDQDDKLCNSCQCDSVRCQYHCKRTAAS